MDISIVITRTGIFIFVYSIVLGIPFALAFGYQEPLARILGEKWWIIPLVSSTVLATAGPFIYLFIQKRAEDRLMQEQRRYQATLRQASSGMNRIKDLNKLLTLIVRIVNRTVNLEHTSVYLYNKHDKKYMLEAMRSTEKNREPHTLDHDAPVVNYLKEIQEPIVYEEVRQRMQDYKDEKLALVVEDLKKLNAELVVPSMVEDKLLGILVLGKKRSGKLFSSDDLAVFSILANQLAVAMENIITITNAKIMQNDLYQAEKLAYVGRLASSVAHEIKNPLTSIKTFVEYLPKKYKEKEFQQNFDRIVPSEIGRIEKIIYQLMDLARPREARVRSVNLNHLIQTTLTLLSHHFAIKHINIKKDFDVDDKIIAADEEYIRQVFLNLFLNAFAAMNDSGTLTVSIRQEQNQTGQLFAKTTVADTGCGMSQEALKNLFTPFYTTKKDGIGLGLVISEEIIRTHNGSISVKSRLGEGTKFTVNLPMVETKGQRLKTKD